jgi:hypothetical protein
MEKGGKRILVRPGITNPRLWYPERPPDSEWRRIRKIVLERDNWTCAACGHRALKWMNVHHLEDSGDNSPENLAPLCVACHAVLHVGFSLMHGSIEVWESEISQVEIVQRTREGVKQGLKLAQIKAQLPLKPGKYPANSTQYANDLIEKIGSKPRAYLDEPLCALFVNLERWQIGEG